MIVYEKIKSMSIDEMADLFDLITEECAVPLRDRDKCKSCPVYLTIGAHHCDRDAIVKWLCYEERKEE